jgi:RNA polymerase sigma-70 factor (ECF subfamily)
VLAGDAAAFETLFDRHVSDALWFAHETLGSREEAEEAVRHSFAAAHAYLATRDPAVDFAPWLHTILSNHCLSMLHARGPRRTAGDVVDLDAWRRKRRQRRGAALPLAPTAGLHEAVTAACGIGTTGAATALPLLGGTLAKVAAIAVLATGAGVAGDVAAQRGEPSAVAGVTLVAEDRGGAGSGALDGPLGPPDPPDGGWPRAPGTPARPDGGDGRRAPPATEPVVAPAAPGLAPAGGGEDSVPRSGAAVLGAPLAGGATVPAELPSPAEQRIAAAVDTGDGLATGALRPAHKAVDGLAGETQPAAQGARPPVAVPRAIGDDRGMSQIVSKLGGRELPARADDRAR